MFRKYQHVCRYGTQETEGILNGKCYIQPKIDGTNGSIWLDEQGNICCGSRNRVLSFDKDNQGFYYNMQKNQNIKDYLNKYPAHRLYGEWLKPHSLRIYDKNAWDKFYVFDVCIDDGETTKYLSYDEYKPLLEEFDIDVIPVLNIINNPDIPTLIKLMNENKFLISENDGVGEGIVIKNYNYTNKYGRIVWAKMIHDEFNNGNKKSCSLCSESPIETQIVEKYISSSVIEKEYQKIIKGDDIEKRKVVPKLLNVIYFTLVTEEMWNVTKDFKNPIVDFKKLKNEVINKIKREKIELFTK